MMFLTMSRQATYPVWMANTCNPQNFRNRSTTICVQHSLISKDSMQNELQEDHEQTPPDNERSATVLVTCDGPSNHPGAPSTRLAACGTN